MNYQVTIRYGQKSQRYLTLPVESEDLADALRAAADGIPVDILPEADLVEIRVAPDFEKSSSDPEDP